MAQRFLWAFVAKSPCAEAFLGSASQDRAFASSSREPLPRDRPVRSGVARPRAPQSQWFLPDSPPPPRRRRFPGARFRARLQQRVREPPRLPRARVRLPSRWGRFSRFLCDLGADATNLRVAPGGEGRAIRENRPAAHQNVHLHCALLGGLGAGKWDGKAPSRGVMQGLSSAEQASPQRSGPIQERLPEMAVEPIRPARPARGSSRWRVPQSPAWILSSLPLPQSRPGNPGPSCAPERVYLSRASE